MQSVETQGRTIDEAVNSALGQLGQRREDVDVEVLRPGTAGVLGAGAEAALVRVTVRGAAGDAAPGYTPEAAPPPYAPQGGNYRAQPDYGGRPDYGNRGREEYGNGGGRGDYGGGRPDYGNQGGYQRGPAPRPGYSNQGGGYQRGPAPAPRPGYGDQGGYGNRGGYGNYPPRQPGYGQQPGYGNYPPQQPSYGNYAPPPTPVPPPVPQPPMPEAPNPEAEELATLARDVMINLLRRMHIPAQVQVEYTGVAVDAPEDDDSDNTVVILNLVGTQDLGMLIGRRGESLTDLQFVFNLMLNKRTRQWGRVMIDVEGYRTRRKEQLVNLAKRMAEQVGTHRQPITLEPMPAYERRIIHLALLDHPYVRTESFGESEDRKVTIFAK